MAYKDDFLNAMKTDGLPSGLTSKQVASFVTPRSYSTAEEAVLAIADVYMNFNKLLVMWEGEKYFDISLRSGQLNPALLAGVLASLEGK